jgi:hypothetical protein
MTNINNVSAALGGTLQQMNPKLCGGIAATSTGAQAAVATYARMCEKATSACFEACKGTDANSVKNLKDCKANGERASDAQAEITRAMLSLKNAVTVCQNNFGDLGNLAQAHCAQDPASCNFTLPNGIQTNALMPDQAGGASGGSLAGAGSSSRGAGPGGGLNLDDLNDDADKGLGEIKPSKPGEEIGGSKGGGHVAGGSSGGNGGGAGGPGGGKKEGGLLTNILSGFWSGGGGIGSALKSFFGGDKGDGYAGRVAANKKNGPDLRQFLPGGLHDPTKNRGIAGQFIGRDGMSGPHSDIWRNIKNRYQYKRASLNP